MNSSRAALASLSVLLVTSVAHADDAAPAPAPAPGKTVASIDPQSRPDPADDAKPTPLTPRIAPAPSAAPVAPTADVAAKQREEQKHEGVLGRHRLGALASAGFPSAVSGQLVYKYADWVGLTASYGATPSFTLPIADGVSLSQRGFSGTGRVYPFRGAFFLGFGAGYSTIHSEQLASQSGIAAHSVMTTNATYATGEIGFLHRFSFGLAIGADIGVQVPMSSSSTSSATVGGQPTAVPKQIQDTMKFLASEPIPVINFLRLGYVL